MSSSDIALGGEFRGGPPFGSGVPSGRPPRTQEVMRLTVGGQATVVAGPLVGSAYGAHSGGSRDGLVFGDRNRSGESWQQIRCTSIVASVDQTEIRQVGPPT